MPEQPDTFRSVARKLVADLRGVPDDAPARQIKRPTRALANLIDELLVKHHIGRHTPEDTIRENWPSIVGPAIAHYSHAAQIDPKGRLTVLYNQPVAGNELRFHQAAILEKIRSLPGLRNVVKGLNIRAG
jgi:Protein of unknown function (DUF721).